MTEHTLLILIFVVFAAAVVLQVLVLIAFYKAVEKSSSQVETTLTRMEKRIDPILTAAQAILDNAQPKIDAITSDLAETTATLRIHISQAAESTGEIIELARAQAVRLDDLVGRTAQKIEETTGYVQHAVVNPVRRIYAVVQAVSAGVTFLRRNRSRNRNSSAAEEDDEEMFI